MTARKLFKDKETEKTWKRALAKKISKELQKRTWEEMVLLLSFADNLKKLKETSLKGKRKGQHSIRINDQWRVCFVWKLGKVYEVELVDYHDEK